MKFINDIQMGFEKHKPEICIFVGAAGLFASGYLFKRAVDKSGEGFKQANDKLDEIETKDISHEEKLDEKLPIYKETIKDTIQLWVGPTLLLVISAKTLKAGFKLADERGQATAEAYATLYSAYQNYRSTVVKNYGEKVDVQMANGVIPQVETKETYDDNGEVVEVVEEGWSSNPGNSIYSFVYTPGHDIEYDLMELKAAQKQLQLRYDAGKPIFVNEVLEMIGRGDMKTPAGQVLGWYYKHPNTSGYVDFGIFNDPDILRRIVDGEFDAIILSFNVDGDIMHCL